MIQTTCGILWKRLYDCWPSGSGRSRIVCFSRTHKSYSTYSQTTFPRVLRPYWNRYANAFIENHATKVKAQSSRRCIGCTAKQRQQSQEISLNYTGLCARESENLFEVPQMQSKHRVCRRHLPTRLYGSRENGGQHPSPIYKTTTESSLSLKCSSLMLLFY